MRRAAAVLALLAFGCNAQQVPPGPAKPRPATTTAKAADEMERGNLLNIALGASVVSRTAELTLDQSALRAIDGDPSSAWNSPPEDPLNQTIVFALPGRTHVEKVGVRTPQAALFRITKLQFDSSVDGTKFEPLATLDLPTSSDVQLFAIAPREATYLRVTTLATAGRFARLESVQARGRFVAPPTQEPIDGCWLINGFSSSFSSAGAHVTGTIAGEHPVSFDGGTDGVVYRFAWVSGPDWGFGAMATAPDKKHLSGLRWYVEPIEFSAAESWFGERARCDAAQKSEDVPNLFLKRAGRFPLYGLRFDAGGTLVESESESTLGLLANVASQARPKPLRIASREFRGSNAQDNAARAKARLDSLRSVLKKRGVDVSRFEWVTLGSDNPPRAIATEIQRVLYGVIELQR